MNLLVVSHACVTSVNLRFFAEIQRETGWRVSIMGPSNWIDDYGTERSLSASQGFKGDTFSFPVWLSGNIPLHVYKSTTIPLLKSLKPDAVYVHNEPYAASTAQIILAIKASGLATTFGFYSAQNIEKRYPPPFSWTEKWVYRTSSFAFPCSETVRETLRSKGYSGKAPLMPLGIDPDLYDNHEDPSIGSSLKSSGEILFGYVGRITREKGLGTLMKSLTSIPNELSWRLALVGDGPQVFELKRLTKDLGIEDRVTWVGYVPHTDAPKYMSTFDALVLPSETQSNWKEQFGRVIVEALSCGTPVVGTDSGEIPHLIRRTGGGIVVKERNPRDLAEGLVKIATDSELRLRLATEGSQYVRSHFTHSYLAKKFAETIEIAVSR